MYVKKNLLFNHTRDFYFTTLCENGWLVLFFDFNNTIFCRLQRKTRRRCVPFVCVREKRSPVRSWWCLMMRKEKLKFSCNLPALLSTRKMFPHVPACFENLDYVYTGRKDNFYSSKNRMEWETDAQRFLSIHSPIKVGPSKWEHREKSNGDVALKAYYAGTFDSSILVPYGKMLLPIFRFFSLFLCGLLPFS